MTTVDRWRVFQTPSDSPHSEEKHPTGDPLADWDVWLRESGLIPGTPFLLSPRYEYDCRLNRFFSSARMLAQAGSTQLGYARDLAAFLTFLWVSRGERTWIDATEADHLAYLYWRRRDPDGPLVAGSTWNREVAAVNLFYGWTLKHGYVRTSPVPQTWRRPTPPEAGMIRPGRSSDELRPATYARDADRDRMQWLTPFEYRRWRDVGIRGFDANGLPRAGFRGRWAARNAAFCDLMVRTGLRVTEQSALTLLDVPLDANELAFQRFWLPEAIAKGGSARWVYVPRSGINDLRDYVMIDRRAVVDSARESYRRSVRPLVVENRHATTAVEVLDHGVQRRVKVASLTLTERRRLLIDGDDGLQPAMLWLGEHGRPMSVHAWKKAFADANTRCEAAGVALSAHPHMLRHTFAVVTLEQLQRGHIQSMASISEEQRGDYARVFGDPLDWVRRRLGHRSVATTQVYLHALSELEMQTRMSLVPDTWESLPAQRIAEPVGTDAPADSQGQKS